MRTTKATFDLIRTVIGTPIVMMGLLIILAGAAIGGDVVTMAVHDALKRYPR